MSEAARWWATAITVAVGLLALLFFFQTKDPMILIFGIIAATMVWVVVRRPAPMGAEVRVRCTACRALNAEAARFCGQCGRAL